MLNSTEPLRPTMASHPLPPSTCDICGENRATRKHQLCSRIRIRIRQRRWAAEWAAYQAEVTAKKAQERRRYVR